MMMMMTLMGLRSSCAKAATVSPPQALGVRFGVPSCTGEQTLSRHQDVLKIKWFAAGFDDWTS